MSYVQYKRKVGHLLARRLSPSVVKRLLKNWDHLIRARWSMGKRPENAANHVVRYDRERLLFGRDAQNPKPGEVYESRAGNRWLVTGKTPKGRVLVKRTTPKYSGELQWTPAMLARLKQVRGQEAKAVEAAIPANLREARFPSGVSLMDRILGKKSGEQLSLFRDPNRRYYVYVIETMKDGKRKFYVGQTGKKPEQRFKEHKRGGHYSYAKGAKLLRKDLTRKVPPLYTRQQAERAEKIIARVLRKRGLKVEGGH